MIGGEAPDLKPAALRLQDCLAAEAPLQNARRLLQVFRRTRCFLPSVFSLSPADFAGQAGTARENGAARRLSLPGGC